MSERLRNTACVAMASGRFWSGMLLGVAAAVLFLLGGCDAMVSQLEKPEVSQLEMSQLEKPEVSQLEVSQLEKPEVSQLEVSQLEKTEPAKAFVQFIPAIIGAIGAIAGSAISAVGQSRAAKAANRANQAAVKTPAQIRNEALAGGFNPLTVLREGGLVQNTPSVIPTLSSLDVVGRTIGGIGDIIGRIDPIEMETKRLENDLLAEQVRAAREARERAELGKKFGARDLLKAGVRGVREITVSPRARTTATVVSSPAAPLGFVRKSLSPDPFVPKGTDPIVPRLGPNALNLPAVEENFGEAGELFGGLFNLGDAAADAAGRWIAEKLARSLSDSERRAKAAELAAYFRGELPRPKWYTGPAKPRTAPFK